MCGREDVGIKIGMGYEWQDKDEWGGDGRGH